jgi:hypothetical protein
VKNGQNFKKIEEYKKDILSKNKISLKKKSDNIKIKEYTPRKNTRNENPVVTQEKEKERALHRVVVTNIVHKFAIKNYYRLNFLLKDLTSKQLYYQPFFDKKGSHKYMIEDKRYIVHKNMKERLNMKDEILFLKKIIIKIKRNEKFLNSIKKKSNVISNYDNNYLKNENIIEKFFNYLIFDKKTKNKSNFLLKLLKIEEKKINKKKEKLNIRKFLRDTDNNIKIKIETNKLLFFNESKFNIINNDKLEKMKKQAFCSFTEYVEKKNLEKIDNKLLYNTVKKYNNEKTKIG